MGDSEGLPLLEVTTECTEYSVDDNDAVPVRVHFYDALATICKVLWIPWTLLLLLCATGKAIHATTWIHDDTRRMLRAWALNGAGLMLLSVIPVLLSVYFVYKHYPAHRQRFHPTRWVPCAAFVLLIAMVIVGAVEFPRTWSYSSLYECYHNNSNGFAQAVLVLPSWLLANCMLTGHVLGLRVQAAKVIDLAKLADTTTDTLLAKFEETKVYINQVSIIWRHLLLLESLFFVGISLVFGIKSFKDVNDTTGSTLFMSLNLAFWGGVGGILLLLLLAGVHWKNTQLVTELSHIKYVDQYGGLASCQAVYHHFERYPMCITILGVGIKTDYYKSAMVALLTTAAITIVKYTWQHNIG